MELVQLISAAAQINQALLDITDLISMAKGREVTREELMEMISDAKQQVQDNIDNNVEVDNG